MMYYCPECKRMVPDDTDLRRETLVLNERDSIELAKRLGAYICAHCPDCGTELQDPDFAEYQQPDPEIDDD